MLYISAFDISVELCLAVVLDLEHIAENENVTDNFSKRLKLSISDSKNTGASGIWLRVPPNFSGLISDAIDLGFEFHHAEKDYLMLTLWMSEGSSRLPHHSSHQGVMLAILFCV